MQIVDPFDLGFIKDIPENIIAAQAEIDLLRTEKVRLKSNLNLTLIVGIAMIVGAIVYTYNQSHTTYEDIKDIDNRK